MESLIRDTRFALRTMMKKPGFTAVAIIIMALGIGANTAIFSLVRAVLLRPLPFADPDRVVMVWEDAAYVGFPKNTPAPGNFADWRSRNDVFEAMAAFRFQDFNLTGDGPPDKIYAYAVTADFFPVLGVNPTLGRVFTPEEDRPEAGNVAVISYPLWQSRYGGDAGIVGRDILLNDTKYTVVGVMPRGFQLLDFMGLEIRLWVPAKFSQRTLTNRGSHYLQVVARMKPGVTLEQANNNIKTIPAQIAHDNPDQAARLDAFVLSLREDLTGESRRPLIVLLVPVAFVLLIAAANPANLLLARARVRSQEVGGVALAMVLLVGAGLLIKTFAHLSDQYASLHAESVLAVRTQLPENRYREPARRFAFYQQVLEHVKALPGVVSAAYTTSVPLDWKGGTNGIAIEGRPVERGVDYDANHRQISPDYFSTIGIALKRGRPFNDGDQPVSDVRTMKDVLGQELGQRETGTTLLGVFAALALLLAAIGLYGVLSYFVSQRIPEFGVRLALGAQSRDILWLVVKRGMGLALLGLAIGLAASFALTRLMQSLLFEVSASDHVVFALIALLLAGVAFAACVIPARRAMKIDPMVALRYE